MSTDLYWKPYVPLKGKQLPLALKHALSKRFFASNFGPIVISNDSERKYIEVLADQGIDGALELLDLLEKYESIELWISE